MKVSAIVLASGKSERFGQNKMLYELNGEPVILKTVKAFDLSPSVDEIVVCVPRENENTFNELLASIKTPLIFANGGQDRHESSVNGLKKATGDVVLIHDGARCFVSVDLIERVISSYEQDFGSIPVINASDSLVQIKDEINYLDRKTVKCVQTPQAFDREKLLAVYENLLKNNVDLSELTDNGSVWQTKHPIKTVDGDIENKKITYVSDCNSISDKTLSFENQLFNINTTNTDKTIDIRVGNGFDMHELVYNRKLILGGVTIPHEKGLLGVSDADVVLHALMDALLSSVSLPDIGHRFPPSDPKYEGADSTKLLENVLTGLSEKGAKTECVSITILAEKPRLSPYITQIKHSIASLLNISVEKVGFSATTTEGLGIIGREEGIACYVTCITRIEK